MCSDDDEEYEEGEYFQAGVYDGDGEHEDVSWTEMKPKIFTCVCRLNAIWSVASKQKIHWLLGHEYENEIGNNNNGSSWGCPDSWTLANDNNGKSYGISDLGTG